LLVYNWIIKNTRNIGWKTAKIILLYCLLKSSIPYYKVNLQFRTSVSKIKMYSLKYFIVTIDDQSYNNVLHRLAVVILFSIIEATLANTVLRNWTICRKIKGTWRIMVAGYYCKNQQSEKFVYILFWIMLSTVYFWCYNSRDIMISDIRFTHKI